MLFSPNVLITSILQQFIQLEYLFRFRVYFRSPYRKSLMLMRNNAHWCKLSNDPLGALSFENLQKCLLKSKQTHQLDTLLEQAESIAWNEHKIQSFIQKLHVCLSHSTNEDETDNYSDFDCYNAQMWGAVFQTWIVKTSN